jgi:putative membrane protein
VILNENVFNGCLCGVFMKFDVFLKGMLMGVCDLVPGISGGTIAFVTGIYERLIRDVSRVLSFSAIWGILLISFMFLIKPGKDRLGDLKKVYKKYDIMFLVTLFLGIIVSIVLGSRIVLFLLEEYFDFTMSFFVGLIVASSGVIYKKIDDHRFNDRMLGVLGFLVGGLLLFLVPVSLNIGMGYVFLSGFIGISAMFLPGISGSYLLYLLGSYEFILHAVKDFDYEVISVFVLGAVLGAVFISRFIVFMFRYYKSKTLYFLFGFVLGALLIPVRDVFEGGVVLWGLVFFFFLGFMVVLFVSRYDKV